MTGLHQKTNCLRLSQKCGLQDDMCQNDMIALAKSLNDNRISLQKLPEQDGRPQWRVIASRCSITRHYYAIYISSVYSQLVTSHTIESFHFSIQISIFIYYSAVCVCVSFCMLEHFKNGFLYMGESLRHLRW